jgi:hypothetical protein
MLLAVDAVAPRLVARSIYYKTLNGGPFCHDIFAVELPGSDVSAVQVACSFRIISLKIILFSCLL